MNVEKDPIKAVYMSSTISEDDEILIERLVDGELSEEERRDLILRLDEMVDGWRFCALSFLEDREFEATFRNLSLNTVANANKTQSSLARGEGASPRSAARGLFRAVVACSACVVVAAVSLSIGRYLLPARSYVDPTIVASNVLPDHNNSEPRLASMAEDSSSRLPALAQTPGGSAEDSLPEMLATATVNEEFVEDASSFSEASSQARSSAMEDMSMGSPRKVGIPAFAVPVDGSVLAVASPKENTPFTDYGGSMGASPAGMGGMGTSAAAMGGGMLRGAKESTENNAFRKVRSARETDDASLARSFNAREYRGSSDSRDVLPSHLESLALDDQAPVFLSAPNPIIYADETRRRFEHINSLPDYMPSDAALTAPEDGFNEETFARGSNNGVALLNCPAEGFADIPVSYSESAQYNPSEIAEPSDVLPKEVIQKLNTAGGRIESQRNEYRFPLNDGRTLIVPVDDYTVRNDEYKPFL